MSSSIYNPSSPPPPAHNTEDADSLEGRAEDPDFSDEDEEDEERPNRWTGPSSTWLSLTEQERGLAASLEALRNRDLSTHLYNSFALRRRGRELVEGNRRGQPVRRIGIGLIDIGLIGVERESG